MSHSWDAWITHPIQFLGNLSILRCAAAAGKGAVGRQKQAQDFSSFLRNASTQEPRRQATSFSSFIRQEPSLHITCERMASLHLTAQLLAEPGPSGHDGHACMPNAASGADACCVILEQPDALSRPSMSSGKPAPMLPSLLAW